MTVTHRELHTYPSITPAGVTPSLLDQMGVPKHPHAELEIIGAMDMYLQGHWSYNQMIDHRNNFISTGRKA